MYRGTEVTIDVMRNITNALLPCLRCSTADVIYEVLDEKDLANLAVDSVKKKYETTESKEYNKDTLAAVYIAERCVMQPKETSTSYTRRLLNMVADDENLLKAIMLLGSPGPHSVDSDIAISYKLTENFFKAIDKVYMVIKN